MDAKTAKKIKSKNSKMEQTLGKAMWASGLRYRKHCKDVFGKPDFCFKSRKIAVFCDSEFWHGKNYLEGEGFKTNKKFWEIKIKRNIERDREVNENLKKSGWTVIRFWGKAIEKHTEDCTRIVLEKINS